MLQTLLFNNLLIIPGTIYLHSESFHTISEGNKKQSTSKWCAPKILILPAHKYSHHVAAGRRPSISLASKCQN